MNTVKDIKEGLQFILHNRGMTILYVELSIVMFFITPLFVLFPFYIEDFLKAPADWYGYILATFTIGNLIGAMIAGIKTSGCIRRNLLITSFIMSSIFWSGMGFVTFSHHFFT